MFTKVIEALKANKEAKTATLYISPTEVIRATWQRKPKARDRSNTIVVSMGAPNYLAVRFIKLAVAAKEPFPVKKIQFDPFPKKRKVKDVQK